MCTHVVTRGARRPAVAPLGEAEQDRPQLVAGLGQVVLEPQRALLVLPLLDDACRLEAAQAAREDVARRAGVPLDRVEAVDAEGQLADDEERPLLAEERRAAAIEQGRGTVSVTGSDAVCHRGLTFPTL